MHVEALADLRDGRQGRAPLGGPNSFIFMQFSGTKLKNNSTFGGWRTPLGKILDPPLRSMQPGFSDSQMGRGVGERGECY